MLQRIPALRALPRFALPPSVTSARLGSQPMRRSTVAGGLCTLEAIAAALQLVGEVAPARELARLHAAALARGWRLRAGGRGRTAA